MVVLEDLSTVGDLKYYEPVQNLKAKKISSSLGLSEATTNLICVNDLRSPQIFMGKKAGTTIKYSDWRNKSIIESGLAIDIATHLPEIKRRLEKAIELQFDSSNENDERWRILALDMLATSIDFVKQLAQYIDDMMRTLVEGGGNDARPRRAQPHVAVKYDKGAACCTYFMNPPRPPRQVLGSRLPVACRSCRYRLVGV